MKYLLILTILLTGCGQFKGEPGKSGNPGLQGKAGTSGQNGERGKQGERGSNGGSGRNGDNGRPGNIDDLIDGGRYCNARYDRKYGWFDLNFWIYNLSTGERYLHGRSDWRSDSSFIPDSGSFFGNTLHTGDFTFKVTGKGKDLKASWQFVVNDKRGSFDCE